jgi:hypothetical protein
MRDTILRTKFTELQRNEERRKTQRSKSRSRPWRGCCRGARWSSRTRTSPPASSSRPSSRPTSPRSIRAARRRISRSAPVLQPHLSDRGLEHAAGRGREAAVRQRRRSGRRTADQLRRRQDALDAGALSHGGGRRCRTCRGSTSLLEKQGLTCRRHQPRGAGRHVAGTAGRAPCRGRPEDPHDLGRTGLAARRCRRFAMVAENDAPAASRRARTCSRRSSRNMRRA